MDLLRHEGLAARVTVPSAANAPPPALAQAWQEQLALAEFRNASDGARERTELEPCGIPAGAGGPAIPSSPAVREPCAPGRPPALLRHPWDSRERAAVRVHVDPPDANGLTVWLGIDGAGALAPQRLASAVADLRRALGRQERIGQLVCNGTSIFSPRKDTP